MMAFALKGDGLGSRIGRGLLTSPKAMIATAICLLLLGAALLAPVIAPQNPYDLTEIDFFDAKLPPMTEGYTGLTYVLGTDGQGRDMLSAMLYGLRTSLAVLASIEQRREVRIPEHEPAAPDAPIGRPAESAR